MIAFNIDGEVITLFDPAAPTEKFIRIGFDEMGVMFETGFSAGAGNFIVNAGGQVNRIQFEQKDIDTMPGGSLFVDAADGELKFKRADDSVCSITS